MFDLFEDTARRARRHLDRLGSRRVWPAPGALEDLDRLDVPLPEEGWSPEEVLQLLDEAGSPATVASAGGRYFGFVTGGALPASLAANWWQGRVAMRISVSSWATSEDDVVRCAETMTRLARAS